MTEELSRTSALASRHCALGSALEDWNGMDKARIEAALLFYGYDMTTEHSPWEVGLGWSVSSDGGDFCGKEAAFKLAGQERFKMAELEIAHAAAVVATTPFYDTRKARTHA